MLIKLFTSKPFEFIFKLSIVIALLSAAAYCQFYTIIEGRVNGGSAIIRAQVSQCTYNETEYYTTRTDVNGRYILYVRSDCEVTGVFPIPTRRRYSFYRPNIQAWFTNSRPQVFRNVNFYEFDIRQ